MRAYQLTPVYAPRTPPPADPGARDPDWSARAQERWLLELDEYEIVNLRRLLRAVAGFTKESDVPVTDFNNGDWVGQIGFYLPETSGRVQPNRPYPRAES